MDVVKYAELLYSDAANALDKNEMERFMEIYMLMSNIHTAAQIVETTLLVYDSSTAQIRNLMQKLEDNAAAKCMCR